MTSLKAIKYRNAVAILGVDENGKNDFCHLISNFKGQRIARVSIRERNEKKTLIIDLPMVDKVVIDIAPYTDEEVIAVYQVLEKAILSPKPRKAAK